MANIQQARRLLTRTGWLSQQAEAFQQRVLGSCMLKRFNAGHVIFSPGDPPGGIFGLVEGAVTVTVAGNASGPHLLHIALPGSWVGDGSFLAREPGRIGLQAVVETWMMRLPFDAMEEIVRLEASSIERFAKVLLASVDILLRAYSDLQDPDDARRIASTLLRIAPEPGTSIPLTQAEIGAMSAASRKQVNAVLQRFMSAGWVKKGYRSVTVDNIPALWRFAHDQAPTLR